MSPRGRAWLCAGVNQLAFPGLGTILAGRKSGYLQAAVMIVGFTLATGFLLWYIFSALCYAANEHWTEATFKARYEPFRWALRGGLMLCAAAWASALCSSFGIVRRARSQSAPGSRMPGLKAPTSAASDEFESMGRTAPPSSRT